MRLKLIAFVVLLAATASLGQSLSLAGVSYGQRIISNPVWEFGVMFGGLDMKNHKCLGQGLGTPFTYSCGQIHLQHSTPKGEAGSCPQGSATAPGCLFDGTFDPDSAVEAPLEGTNCSEVSFPILGGTFTLLNKTPRTVLSGSYAQTICQWGTSFAVTGGSVVLNLEN